MVAGPEEARPARARAWTKSWPPRRLRPGPAGVLAREGDTPLLTESYNSEDGLDARSSRVHVSRAAIQTANPSGIAPLVGQFSQAVELSADTRLPIVSGQVPRGIDCTTVGVGEMTAQS